ncbi:hypothetical protein [Aquisphaera insulae]|uniref:hypothetical protein n=1 Tax=Aquisphaera insulae TaxID=2712864 RepID=UPI0013EC1D35|nr:hypothetical protein [Aquisphaera insulae]
MRDLRLVRAFALVPLAGFLLLTVGCSGQVSVNSTPPSKEEAKKIAEETKSSMRDAMKARGQKGH